MKTLKTTTHRDTGPVASPLLKPKQLAFKKQSPAEKMLAAFRSAQRTK